MELDSAKAFTTAEPLLWSWVVEPASVMVLTEVGLAHPILGNFRSERVAATDYFALCQTISKILFGSGCGLG